MDPRVRHALQTIEQNYAHPLCLRDIIVELRISPSRFEHLFKHEVGQTYKGYLREMRMGKAVSLLKDSFLNISEVAYQVGYSYGSNFARDFKTRFGKTPSQYRHEAIAGLAKE